MKGIRTDAFDNLIQNRFEGKTMSEQTPVSKTIYNYPPKDVEGFDALAELALDMRWSWNHATDQVWRQLDPQAPLTCVAYFSMEFMLSEALPIYSGGLGNVAGDQLKAASDLGVPVV